MTYLPDRRVGPPITRPPIPRDDRYGVDDKKAFGHSQGQSTAFVDGRILRECIFGNERNFLWALVAADFAFDHNLAIGRALYVKDTQMAMVRGANVDMRAQWQIWADGRFVAAAQNNFETQPIGIYFPPLTNVRFYVHFTSAAGNRQYCASFEWIEFSAELDAWDWGHGSSIENPGVGAFVLAWP